MARRKRRVGTRVKTPKGKFRSKYEAKIQAACGDVIDSYESARIEYVTSHTYTPDFLLTNGVAVEAKGLFTAQDRAKLLAIKRQHPGVIICLLFMRDQPISKRPGSKFYGEWCDSHGFEWDVGEQIPKAWTKLKPKEPLVNGQHKTTTLITRRNSQ